MCGLRAAFVDNWAETGRPSFDEGIDRFPEQPQEGDSVVQVVRGATETGWSYITTVVRTLLRMARRRVRITTAYFAPDDYTCKLLCETAQRGVDVEILLPGPHIDKRFVQLASESDYEALLDAGLHLAAYQPTMLHAKVAVLDAHFDDDVSRSEDIYPGQWKDRGLLQRAKEAATTLVDQHF